MSKLIYDEVLDILVDSFKDPQDEDNDLKAQLKNLYYSVIECDYKGVL